MKDFQGDGHIPPFNLVVLLLWEGYFGHNTHTYRFTLALIYNQLSKTA